MANEKISQYTDGNVPNASDYVGGYLGSAPGVSGSNRRWSFTNIAKRITSLIGAPQTLTDASTINWDASLGSIANLTLGGNHTLAAPTNLVEGQTYKLLIISQGNTLTWDPAYVFPTGAPTLNPVSGAIDIFEFTATSTSSLLIKNYASTPINWSNYDGTNNPTPQYGPNHSPNTSNATKLLKLSNTTLVYIYSSTSSNIVADVITLNSRGMVTAWAAAQAIAGTITTSAYFSAAVISSTQFVVGYKNTSVNVVGVSVSGTTITAGTAVQIRSAETSSGGVEVGALDSSNFAAMFRTATANILYVYQCTISGNTVTAAADAQALALETGAGSTFDGKLIFRDSTHLWAVYRSTAGSSPATAQAITFSGISNTPVAGNTLVVTSAPVVSATSGASILPVTINSTSFATWILTTSNVPVVTYVVDDGSGNLSIPGTPLTLSAVTGAAMGAIILLDALHIMVITNDNNGSNTDAYIFMLSGSSYVFQGASTLLNSSIGSSAINLGAVIINNLPFAVICSTSPRAFGQLIRP